AQVAIGIVFDDGNLKRRAALDQGVTALQAKRQPGGILEVGQHIDKASAGGDVVGEARWYQPAIVRRHRLVAGLEQRKGLDGTQVAGGFDQDLAARIYKQLAQHIEGLL